jgi:hypothetical protein
MRAREDRDYLINKTFGTEETEMTTTTKKEEGPVRRRKADVDEDEVEDNSDRELE